MFDLTGMIYTTEQLPLIDPIVWVRGQALPTELLVVLLWHGESRAGDIAAWVPARRPQSRAHPD